MSTAVAQPNIALIKYWGKVDEALIIPATDSVSLTLDGFPTTTTVTLTDDPIDVAVLNGVTLQTGELGRITRVLDRVRDLSGIRSSVAVESTNTIPTAAGLASSAAGFAALAKAASAAFGLDLADREVSRLARIGSGSASRSVFGGMVRWNRGNSDETSYAEPLEWNGPELMMVIAQVSTARKTISSREGMTRTVNTSPFYDGWVSSNQQLVGRALQAAANGDEETLGALTELSAMRMHASMLGAEPPIRYLTSESFALIDAVAQLRADGLTAYTTADAGPNIKILTTSTAGAAVVDELTQRFPTLSLLTSTLGQGVYLHQERTPQ